MSVESFAEWFRLQGHRVIRSQSSYWYDAGPRTYQAFPFHWIIQPSESELRSVLAKQNAISLRYSTPLASEKGMASYHIISKRPYELKMLKSQARNGIRKGQKYFQVERIPFERLADEGWQVQQDTLERQNRLKSMNQDTWRKLCLSARGLDGFEAWGAICQGELEAAIITARIDDIYCVPYALSRTKCLSNHVNNLLFYTAIEEILGKDEISGIFFTVQSLDAPESVDEFKFRMSLMAIPVRQRVVFHPLCAPISTSFSHKIVRRLAQRYPDSGTLAKAEGMIRFSVLGRLPLAEQEWPKCVEEYREQAIAKKPYTSFNHEILPYPSSYPVSMSLEKQAR